MVTLLSAIVLGIALGLASWLWNVVRKGDPISQFARAAFKMKLDRKTGRFWARPKGDIQPPCACQDCEMVGCQKGNEKKGWVLVDCPDLKSSPTTGDSGHKVVK